MPSIAGSRLSPVADQTPEIGNNTPQKRFLRSDSARIRNTPISSTPLPVQTSPLKRKSPRRCVNDSPNSPLKVIEKSFTKSSKSPVKKKLSDSFLDKPAWDPSDMEQLSAVKEALHVSTAPTTVMCREDEQNRILQFCKECVELQKAGSLYVCGCPGTGKSLSMEKVKEVIVNWAKEADIQPPETLSINCTTLTNASEIFSKIVGRKAKGSTLPLQDLRNLYSQKHLPGTRMVLIIVDELDYLITKDRAVLHDLFMLTTMPFSKCILIGIANAIDLADRFLPKLQSLNCKPMVITFRAYSKDQIITILKQRLMALPYTVFQPQALELCARKVAAASGDMRKALSICRSAIEMLEAEVRDSISKLTSPSLESDDHQISAAYDILPKPVNNIVRVDHVAIALSKAYRSPVVDTIQSLPQHQQIILCSAVKLFRGGKKDTTVGELNKSYMDVCKSTLIPPVGNVEFSSMCRVLGDQGILKLGQSREDKLRRVELKIDGAVVSFALQINKIMDVGEIQVALNFAVGKQTRLLKVALEYMADRHSLKRLSDTFKII